MRKKENGGKTYESWKNKKLIFFLVSIPSQFCFLRLIGKFGCLCIQKARTFFPHKRIGQAFEEGNVKAGFSFLTSLINSTTGIRQDQSLSMFITLIYLEKGFLFNVFLGVRLCNLKISPSSYCLQLYQLLYYSILHPKYVIYSYICLLSM